MNFCQPFTYSILKIQILNKSILGVEANKIDQIQNKKKKKHRGWISGIADIKHLELINELTIIGTSVNVRVITMTTAFLRINLISKYEIG